MNHTEDTWRIPASTLGWHAAVALTRLGVALAKTDDRVWSPTDNVPNWVRDRE